MKDRYSVNHFKTWLVKTILSWIGLETLIVLISISWLSSKEGLFSKITFPQMRWWQAKGKELRIYSMMSELFDKDKRLFWGIYESTVSQITEVYGMITKAWDLSFGSRLGRETQSQQWYIDSWRDAIAMESITYSIFSLWTNSSSIYEEQKQKRTKSFIFTFIFIKLICLTTYYVILITYHILTFK